jgi:divalent metal cation (Fe/Co/Zn/Cd) transporter
LRKRRVSAQIPSHALLADSWLSAAGAVLGVLTLVGSALERALGWWWLDPVAATLVACGALALSWVLARGEHTALDPQG